MQIKLIFTTKVLHLASFLKWEFVELGNGLLWALPSAHVAWTQIEGTTLALVNLLRTLQDNLKKFTSCFAAPYESVKETFFFVRITYVTGDTVHTRTKICLWPKICWPAANTEASNRTREYSGYGGRTEVARVVGETQSKKCVTKRPGMRTEMYSKFHREKFVLMQTVPKARQLR